MRLLDIPLDEFLGDDVAFDSNDLLERAAARAPLGRDGHGSRRGLAVDDGVDALGDVRQRHLERRLPDRPLVRDLVDARLARPRGPGDVLLRDELRTRDLDVQVVVVQAVDHGLLRRLGGQRRRDHCLGGHVLEG